MIVKHNCIGDHRNPEKKKNKMGKKLTFAPHFPIGAVVLNLVSKQPILFEKIKL